jgi:hypothetical protein
LGIRVKSVEKIRKQGKEKKDGEKHKVEVGAK